MYALPVVTATVMKLPDSTAFQIFGLAFHWYGILLAVGVIAAIILAHLESRRKEMPPDTAIDLCLIALPCGVVGARIAYVLLNLSQFKGRVVEVLYLWDGGLSAIGAVILSLVGILLYARKKRLCPLNLFDMIAPGVTAALAISSWGHFFNQDFYGPLVTKSAWKWFPLCVRIDNLTGKIHLALFFFLFVGLALLFAFQWFYLRKRTARIHSGDVALALVLGFSLLGAVLSALRTDGTGRYLPEQIGGGLVFVAALSFSLIRYLREKRLGRQIWPESAGSCAVGTSEGPEAEKKQAPAAKKTSASKKEPAKGKAPAAQASKAKNAAASKKKPVKGKGTAAAKQTTAAKKASASKKAPAKGKAGATAKQAPAAKKASPPKKEPAKGKTDAAVKQAPAAKNAPASKKEPAKGKTPAAEAPAADKTPTE